MKQRMTYALVLSGLLIAMSVVLTRVFGANFPIAGVPAGRLSIGFVPIMLAGIILGPWWGGAVGVFADAIGFLLAPNGTFFPPITLTSALVGVLPGLLYRLFWKKPEWLKAALSVASVQILCSMLLQTFWLSILLNSPYQALFFPRALVALVMTPIYILFVYSVMVVLKRAKVLPRQPA
jgi:ECF transporter S component (folate family)